jgi:predicted anti-sigma-YlaC factor YlaD
MKHTNTNCKMVDEKLADLLLDPHALPAKVHAHVAECSDCQAELAKMRAAMQLLDTWEAPEPSPYFLTRLGARMREEREAAPAGWLARGVARIRASIAYGPGLHARPLAAMALTVVLLVGGGAYLGVTDWMQPVQPTPLAATVNDLQILDSNAQVLDQMEALSSSQSGD